MNTPVERISKACDPCRTRKIRCNGQEPCGHCQKKPSACVYRLRNRIRARKSTQPNAQNAQPQQQQPSPATSLPTPIVTNEVTEAAAAKDNQPENSTKDAPQGKVYHGVMASHSISGESVGPAGNSQLFYGPSSNFAFLQQIHRSLLFSHGNGRPGDRAVQEGGPGLDMFMQRSIFFGIPSQVDMLLLYQSFSTPLVDILPPSEAQIYLDHFKAASYHLLPFYTESELDQLLHRLYEDDPETSGALQTKGLILAMIANGVLQTSNTALAETLFARAKFQMTLFEDTVTLTMIQYSLVAADYQLHMGRPNSAYLHLGNASRQAFAMGLHKEPPQSSVRQDSLEMQRTTMWCLYFHESWHALSLGRQGAIRHSDISRPFPEGQSLVVGLSRLAHIAEQSAEAIYGRRYDSLRQLYYAAESIHCQLKQVAELIGIGSAPQQSLSDHVALQQLHNIYYHTIILTFRPFIIAGAASTHPEGGSQPLGEQMWLRQACRSAVDAAQDLIMYSCAKIRTVPRCRALRFNAYFLESSCGVLLYDMLWHPSKHECHLEYIQMTLACLESMVDEQPVVTARESLQQILRAVEGTISKQSSNMSTPADITSNFLQFPNVQFPPSGSAESSVAEQLIHFSDALGIGNRDLQPAMMSATSGESVQNTTNPELNVFTTDLHSFFPCDIETPSTSLE
ncbi:hypothetical protein PFICI_04749 [Pestalotiopsis fici W106-1]|uniref:Zn(2)-C6 fungal-type domain-containing protein n=1 Tax=Pestalotiopsis fici (strain W106-1 / CGMCC3.15140) TaxID=1229662 RepID=W3X9T6_PESFW|nr:uncharacterized protein PFICI_04749 [Pestalotiopsis fici W106-1]ETS82873.1 hypothetical protein PFICI_04749 [Pestalotiopsis fici W106-1]